MTSVYVTIDTELSSSHFARHGVAGLRDNYARTITGETDSGTLGIGYQMDQMDAHGIKGVFFVDPMPALVGGRDLVRRITDDVLGRGHDVQLHIHTEWLGFAPAGPTDGRAGRNMADFSLDDQVRIIDFARQVLDACEVPAPIAFRAGNYGANDATLTALDRCGLRFDSSFSPALRGGACKIDLPTRVSQPIWHQGIVEVPIAAIEGWGGTLRHVQLTALSAAEMRAALLHAERVEMPHFTVVMHSFELLSRARGRANPIVVNRFDALCATLAAQPGLTAATYAQQPPVVCPEVAGARLPHAPVRTMLRSGEQLISSGLYGETASPMPDRLKVPAMTLRDRVLVPFSDLVPLQNVALDLVSLV